MQLTCLYHPVLEMMVTDDEDNFKAKLASGLWFEHPSDAKNMRNDYEKQSDANDERKRSRKTKKNAGIA
jgi:hypothetical protein